MKETKKNLRPWKFSFFINWAISVYIPFIIFLLYIDPSKDLLRFTRTNCNPTALFFVFSVHPLSNFLHNCFAQYLFMSDSETCWTPWSVFCFNKLLSRWQHQLCSVVIFKLNCDSCAKEKNMKAKICKLLGPSRVNK